MILASILHRELRAINEPINILWTPTDNVLFREFIKKCLGPNLLEFDNTYLGNYPIDIIICNNRISHLDKCVESAKYFHCPILVVDHEPKPISINIDPKQKIMIEPVLKIAINKQVSDSWGSTCDKIISYDCTKKDSIEQWHSLVLDLIKSIVRIPE